MHRGSGRVLAGGHDDQARRLVAVGNVLTREVTARAKGDERAGGARGVRDGAANAADERVQKDHPCIPAVVLRERLALGDATRARVSPA